MSHLEITPKEKEAFSRIPIELRSSSRKLRLTMLGWLIAIGSTAPPLSLFTMDLSENPISKVGLTLLVQFIFIIVSISKLRGEWELLKNGVVTIGRYQDIEEIDHGSQNGKSWKVVLSYLGPGNIWIESSPSELLSKKPEYQDIVTVLYLPNSPSRTMVYPGTWLRLIR